MGVLSNKFDAGAQDVIAAYLPNTFDAVHGESADYPRKPNPTGLLRMLAELGVSPDEAIYILAILRETWTSPSQQGSSPSASRGATSL